MPPANDAFANAIDLGQTQSGRTAASNVDATGEAGEPTNNGKTVWWKWTAPTSDRFSFSTRHVPGLTFQTDFETVLDVYTGTVVSALVQKAHGGRYAGWEFQSLATFDAIGGQLYYIRVDGAAGAEGNIRLSWDLAADVRPGDCADCPPRSNVGNACAGSFKPGITGLNFKDFSVPAGRYIVRYCGGAWNYRDGWVVGLVPTGAEATWPTQLLSDFFFAVAYNNVGPKQIGLNENGRLTNGWPSLAAAEDAAKCSRASFFHDGTGVIRLHYSDKQYSDNYTYNNNSPVYSLDHVTPVLQELQSSPSRHIPETDGEYECAFRVQNLTDADFPNVSAELLIGGGISNAGPNSPRVVSFQPLNETQIVYFDFIVTPYTRLNVIATIRLTDSQNIYRDLVYDLTPRLTARVISVGSSVVAGVPKTRVDFNLSCFGMPTLNLRATPTGVSGLVNGSGTPVTFYDLGNVNTGTSLLTIYFTPGSGSIITLAFADTVGTGATFPSSIFNI